MHPHDFLRANVTLYFRRGDYIADFADALEHFVAACRAICGAGTIPHLSRAIRKVFREAGLEYVLDEQRTEALALPAQAETPIDRAASAS